MNLIYGYDEVVAEWVAERIPHVGASGFGLCSAIGIATDTALIGGMVYHDYQEEFGTIQLSIATTSPMWARKEIIRDLLAYPFFQLDCFKVWAAVPADNEPAIKTNIHAGFTKEAVLAHQFGRKRHAVICRMLKTDFIKKYGLSNG